MEPGENGCRVIHPETIAGRKAYFQKKRAAFVATWKTDENGVVHIPLGDGFEALILDHHKDKAANFYWHLKLHSKTKSKYYAEAHVPEEYRGAFGLYTSLHRVVLGVDRNVEIDHADGNGLNCRDWNLRIATRSQNSSNRHYKNITGYRGVFRQLRCMTNPFGAQIEYSGKNHRLGSFPTAIEAAKAYNEEAIRVFGEFAILNRIEESCQETNNPSGGKEVTSAS